MNGTVTSGTRREWLRMMAAMSGAALVNERDAAIDFFERAVEFGFINLPWLSEYEPFLANLRGEPRFVRLMERVRRAWEAFEP